MKKLICAALLTMTTMASALIDTGPCQFTLEGEWLYFQPSVDAPHFVEFAQGPGPSSNRGRKIKNSPDWDSGYRILGQYHFSNCTDVSVRWTQFNETYSRTATAAGNATATDFPIGVLFPLVETASFGSNVAFSRATAHSTLDYYSIEALLGQTLFGFDSFYLKGSLGLQYANAQVKDNYNFSGTTGPGRSPVSVSYKSRFWGIGPQIGTDLSYDLCWGLALTGKFNTALLVTKNHFNAEMLSTANGVNQGPINEPFWRIVPEVDLRAGLNYRTCFGCFTFDLEAGYEALAYFRALTKNTAAVSTRTSNPGWAIDTYSNLSFQGPYVALAITY